MANPQLSPSVAWTLPPQPQGTVDASENARTQGDQLLPSDSDLARSDSKSQFRICASAPASVSSKVSPEVSLHIKPSSDFNDMCSQVRTMPMMNKVMSERTERRRSVLDKFMEEERLPLSNHTSREKGVASIRSMMSVQMKPSHVEMLRKCIESNVYSIVSALALGFALFGGATFLLLNIPDDPGTPLLDVIMTLVTIFFLVEIVIMWLAGNGYAWSFFFWMDVIGTISMMFEISYLLGTAGKKNVSDSDINTVFLRSARAAKTGARAARLSKVAKCFTFTRRHNSRSSSMGKERLPEYDAHVLKARLNLSLSTKVSLLTVVLVVFTPLFNITKYPEEDFSMQGWSRILEFDYNRAWQHLENDVLLQSTDYFSAIVNEMVSFYKDLNYYPYNIEGYAEKVSIHGGLRSIPGEALVYESDPVRLQNVLQQQVSTCLRRRPGCQGDVYASIYFNFQGPHQHEAAMDIAVILFIIACMIAETADLSRTVDRLVVRPVERMLGTVQLMAQMFQTVEPHLKKTSAQLLDLDKNLEGHSETLILESVFAKFRVIISVFLSEDIAQDEELQLMDHESKGVLLDILGAGSTPQTNLAAANDYPTSLAGKVVEALPVEEHVINSWELELLSMPAEGLTNVAMYIFFDSQDATGRVWADLKKFAVFHETIKNLYLANPYHNYAHACDVVASVYRVFMSLRCKEWLSDIDMYSLLVSALCHDVAHPGRTTPFLIETKHELAVRYNDASPLENMHCAKLFEICNTQETNAFAKFEQGAYKQARKVCITAILHTDNSLHFDMVKAVKDFYEQTSDICDTQATNQNELSELYVEEVLCKNTVIWHKLILHLCDVATPLKPWHISRAWATRVQDEFFEQGDEEKRLGLPVGMLNDREKVNRSGAEHGFIIFLVAPLALSSVGLFPSLHYLISQMANNLKEWRNLWAEDAKPSAEDLAKRDADVKRIAEQVEKLRVRKPVATVRTQEDAGLSKAA